jgi:hypothetical protein
MGLDSLFLKSPSSPFTPKDYRCEDGGFFGVCTVRDNSNPVLFLAVKQLLILE